MRSQHLMSTSTPVSEISASNAAGHFRRLATPLEVLLVYTGILLYIWRWQFTHPRAWVLLLMVVLSSHVAHRDTPRAIGLTFSELRANAQLIFPLALALYIPLLLFGLARHSLVLTSPGRQALWSFLGYGLWCAFQQYLAQSYFHNRLMSVIKNPHLRSVLVAVMFGAAHIPNPILMLVTALGGFILAEVFARHQNIWPLALAQAVGGFLVGALSPASLIHNMRVGPGYFFYGLR